MTSICPYELGMMNSGIELSSDDIMGNVGSGGVGGGGCELNSYNSLFSPLKYTDQTSGESSSTILQEKAISSPCLDAYLDSQQYLSTSIYPVTMDPMTPTTHTHTTAATAPLYNRNHDLSTMYPMCPHIGYINDMNTQHQQSQQQLSNLNENNNFDRKLVPLSQQLDMKLSSSKNHMMKDSNILPVSTDDRILYEFIGENGNGIVPDTLDLQNNVNDCHIYNSNCDDLLSLDNKASYNLDKNCNGDLCGPNLIDGNNQLDMLLTKDDHSRHPYKSDSFTSKARWKPNQKQLCLLEQHFLSGYTKATPELIEAVKSKGLAIEAQGDIKKEDLNELDEGAVPCILGNKRERNETECWEDFSKVKSMVFEELSGIINSIDSSEIIGVARAIRDSKRICCYGVGREGYVMKGLSLNLFHLGLKSYFVGDTTTPRLCKGDLFLVSAGPSYYSTVSALSLEAMRSGAKVIAFTAHKTAPLPFANSVIRIASQTLPPCMPVMTKKLGSMDADYVSSLADGKMSVMQMGSSFELSLSLTMECVCIMLKQKLKVQSSDMKNHQTNLA